MIIQVSVALNRTVVDSKLMRQLQNAGHRSQVQVRLQVTMLQ